MSTITSLARFHITNQQAYEIANQLLILADESHDVSTIYVEYDLHTHDIVRVLIPPDEDQ